MAIIDDKDEERLQIELDDLYFKFGRNVNFHRVQLNINQLKLAEKIGLSGRSGRTAVSQIELGKRNIKLDLMMRLAMAFDMKLDIRFVPLKTKDDG